MDRVSLRDVIADDLPIFFEHQRDPDGARMVAFEPRNREAFMAHWAKMLVDDSVVKKTVLVDGQVAGNMVSFEYQGHGEVGYWIGKEFWGRGIATRALTEFLTFVPVRPLYGYVAKHNLASRRVLEKCGFTLWGEDSRPLGSSGAIVEEFVLALREGE